MDPLVLKQKVIKTYSSGRFKTHLSPDADAYVSLYVVYLFLIELYPSMTMVDFIRSIDLIPHNNKVEDSDFGVDIGTAQSNNSIKNSNGASIIVENKLIRNSCASLFLAYHLLPYGTFDALKEFLLEINSMDLHGKPASYIFNNDKKSRTKGFHLTSIWGIIASISSTSPFEHAALVIFSIFNALLASSIEAKMGNCTFSLQQVEFKNINGFRLTITPLNASRPVINQALKKSDIVLFASYNPINMLGTFGVSVAKSSSNRIDLNKIKESESFALLNENIPGGLYIQQWVAGRLDKNQLTDINEEVVIQYALILQNLVEELLMMS